MSIRTNPSPTNCTKPKKPPRITRNNALFAAFLIYGAFSSPTPDAPGWAEALIGLLLLLAITPSHLFNMATGKYFTVTNRRLRYLYISFLVLLIVPLVTALMMQHDMRDILRDVIPLGYFFFPLFLYPLIQSDPVKTKQTLIASLCYVGVFFSLRFWPSSGLSFSVIGQSRGNDELLYLTSSPAVTFAGLYLLFRATDLAPQNLWKRIAFFMLSLTCLLAIAAILQRAALALITLSIWCVFLPRIVKTPAMLMFCITLLIIGGIAAGDRVIDLIGTIVTKTAEVGDNQRFAELRSVFDHLGNSLWAWLGGSGWGTRIFTAASGYADVRYTHMLLGYILLKAGLIGLAALGVYLTQLVQRLRRLFHTDPVLIASVLPSLFLGLTLYPSFKMLCFGAMLALVWSASSPMPQSESPDAG